MYLSLCFLLKTPYLSTMKETKQGKMKIAKLSAILPHIPVSSRSIYHRIKKGDKIPGVERYEKSGTGRTCVYWLYIAPGSPFYDKLDTQDVF